MERCVDPALDRCRIGSRVSARPNPMLGEERPHPAPLLDRLPARTGRRGQPGGELECAHVGLDVDHHPALQYQCAAGVPGRELGHFLGESRFAAIEVVTERSEDPQPDHDLAVGDRGVRQPSLVMAVNPAGLPGWDGTSRRR